MNRNLLRGWRPEIENESGTHERAYFLEPNVTPGKKGTERAPSFDAETIGEGLVLSTSRIAPCII